MSVRQAVVIACAITIAATSLFGLFYDPGHPWMDRRRKLGVGILCIAFVVGFAAILVGQV